VEEGQLRLVRAVALGDPDFFRARAIAHERDALAVRRHTEIALVTIRFDQRTRLSGALAERHLEYLGFDLPRDVDHAAGLPRHARLRGNHGRSGKPYGLAAIARDAPQRAVSASGRTREQDLPSVGCPIQSIDIPNSGRDLFRRAGGGSVAIERHYEYARIEGAGAPHERQRAAIRRQSG